MILGEYRILCRCISDTMLRWGSFCIPPPPGCVRRSSIKSRNVYIITDLELMIRTRRSMFF